MEDRSLLTWSDRNEILSTLLTLQKIPDSLEHVAMNKIEHYVVILEGSRAVLIPS